MSLYEILIVVFFVCLVLGLMGIQILMGQDKKEDLHDLTKQKRDEAKKAFRDALATVHVSDEIKDNAVDKLIECIKAEVDRERKI